MLSENLGAMLDVGAIAVPEPSTLVLLTVGGIGLFAYVGSGTQVETLPCGQCSRSA